MKRWTNKSTRGRSAVLTVAAFAVIVASSQASHWGQQGADPGRSSYQNADPAQLPMPVRWRAAEAPTGTSSTAPATSPLITSGATLADQRVAYGYQAGSANTYLRIRRLSDGVQVADVPLDDPAPVDPDLYVGCCGDDPDGWGPPDAPGGNTPMEASSGHSTPGMIYAVYNDDNANDDANPNPGRSDIQLAQVDPVDGSVDQDRSLAPGTVTNPTSPLDGYTIMSAPVMSADQGNGDRFVAFTVAQNQDGATVPGNNKKLVVFTIPNAHAQGVHAPTGVSVSANIPDLNQFAPPTFVRMREKQGSRVNMVMVATTDGLKTFRVTSLADPGPSVTGLGLTWTASVPARVDGSSPTATPFVYAASAGPNGGTIVRRFKQDESDVFDPEKLATLIPAGDNSVSAELSGKPSAQLALTQTIPTVGPDVGVPQPGRVIVSTSKNVFSLDTEDLGAADPARVFNGDRATGFTRTFPSASGDLAFIVDDKGQHFTFFTEPQEGTGLRVPPDETGFTPHEFSLNATLAKGQPAVSRGRTVMLSNNGAYTYGPNVAITKPASNAAVFGNQVTLEAYAFNPLMTSVSFSVDGVPVGTDNVNDDRTFSVTWNSFSVLEGPHVVVARATDGIDTETSAPRTFIVNNYLNPTADLTVAPGKANPDTPVTLDASGSKPTASEVGETIVRWAFEIDGDNDYDDIVEVASSGGDGKVTRTFEAGVHTIGVRVTDSHGDIAQKTAQLRVNAPPAANLAVSPNPAVEGQEVSVDASGSTDADGSITRYEFDLDGNGTFELDHGTNPKVQRVFAPGTTKVSTRVTDSDGATTATAVDVVVNAKPANQVPGASFTATPASPKVDQRVTFDATPSKDADGSIVKFEWDLDGNGSFETNSGANPRVQRSYATAKVYNVQLRVTDNAGAVSTVFTRPLTVSGGRQLPRRLSAKVTPTRDGRAPFRFTTSGRLSLPTGVARKAGCTGRVTVVVKAGKRTISRRTTRLRSNCSYRTSVTFRDTRRFARSRTLRVTARFQGNSLLRARQAKSLRPRVR